MLKAIEIEQDLPDHLLCLVESYKQLADDFFLLEDYAQCVQACELGLQIELQLFDEGVLNPNIQESLLFLAEAYATGQEPVKSNEQLSNILEAFGHENISDEVQMRTLSQVVANLTSLEQYEECIQYQMRLLKLTERLSDKTNIYQEIANNFLQLNDHESAVENQRMVCKLVRLAASGAVYETLDEDDLSDGNLADVEEDELTVKALFNLIQIQFLIIQGQIQDANEMQDASRIDGNLLLDTKQNLETCIKNM